MRSPTTGHQQNQHNQPNAQPFDGPVVTYSVFTIHARSTNGSEYVPTLNSGSEDVGSAPVPAGRLIQYVYVQP